MDSLMMDEVIKRRLLIDGDGVGDDRRIVGLTKSFISWCNADETPEECAVSHKRLLSQLSQVEYTARRTHHNIVTNEKAKKMYSDLGKEVKEGIEVTRKEIGEAKELLVEATKHRKHSLEFDALAKLIESKPDRVETQEKVHELEQEIGVLEKRKECLDSRLEGRKKQMFIIATAVDQVEEVLKEHDEYELQMAMTLNTLLNEPPTQQLAVTPVGEPSTPVGESSMETDDIQDSSSGSEQTSPMQQSPDHSPDESTIAGTVTSSSSPLEKKFEKYDDLSEASDGEGDRN